MPDLEGRGALQRCPRRAESGREALFAAIATQVGHSWFGAKGVGITYPSGWVAVPMGFRCGLATLRAQPTATVPALYLAPRGQKGARLWATRD